MIAGATLTREERRVKVTPLFDCVIADHGPRRGSCPHLAGDFHQRERFGLFLGWAGEDTCPSVSRVGGHGLPRRGSLLG
jgi:hypothetical protein